MEEHALIGRVEKSRSGQELDAIDHLLGGDLHPLKRFESEGLPAGLHLRGSALHLRGGPARPRVVRHLELRLVSSALEIRMAKFRGARLT